MSRQYYTQTIEDPQLSGSAAVSSTGETQLWNVPSFTPIPAFEPRAGRVYKVYAGGVMAANTTGGTITVTPRIGTTVAGGTTLGASVAKVYGTTFSGQPWWMEFIVVFRSVGAPGTNSGVIGEGWFVCTSTTTANQQVVVNFGGSIATCDTSINQGISIGVALTSATMTTSFAIIQSLN